MSIHKAGARTVSADAQCHSPGKEPYSIDQMTKDVDKESMRFAIDPIRLTSNGNNFQFGGTAYGSGTDRCMLNDVAYQANTLEFWNSCVKICDDKDYRLFGSFFDGKGQPGQASAVSHGSSTARFNNVNVINTGRTI